MITSLISKFGTIILRLVSIPIALRLLGIDQFGVYAAITMAVAMIASVIRISARVKARCFDWGKWVMAGECGDAR